MECATNHGLLYLEVSASSGMNANLLFEELAHQTYEKHKNKIDSDFSKIAIEKSLDHREDDLAPKKKSKC